MVHSISFARPLFSSVFILAAVATPQVSFNVPQAADGSQQQTPKPLSAVEVLQYEVNRLKQENAKLEDDKQQLLNTVRTFMQNNETRLLQRQLVDLTNLKASVENRCAHERAELQAQAAQVGGQLKIEIDKLNATSVSTRETIQSMKDYNKQLTTKLFATQAEMEDWKRRAEAAASDKQQVVEAMNGVLKQNDLYLKEAKARATHEQRKHLRKEAETAAVKKLRGMQHHNHKNATEGGRRLRRKPTPQEDPTLYMGDESAITDYIAEKRQESGKAALSADLKNWLDNVPLPEADASV